MTCKQVVRWCTVAGVCAWLTIVGARSSYGEMITIDSFDLPDKGTVFILPLIHGIQWDHTDSAGNDVILGGEREVSITIASTLDPSSMVAVGVIGVDRNVLDGNGMFSFGSQAAGGQLDSGSVIRLTYDGLGQSGLGSFDLTDGGANTDFALRFASSDGVVPEGLDVTITAGSFLGSTLTYTGYIPNHSDPLEPLVHRIPFSKFTAVGNLASFDTIETLTFEFNGDRTPNVDFSLDLLATVPTVVPEPSSIALLGLCLAAFVGRILRRRRRR